ncbi:MAG: aldo/keto reductase [Tepidisphaeraceae bacterium]
MTSKLRWGIIGTGAIAKCFAENIGASETGTLAAVGSRSEASAKAFADKHKLAKAYGSYDALIGDAEIDAIYVSTPHPQHAEWSIKAIRAGKHVLCEKPFALNWAESMAVIEEATLAGVTLMEAFMWRTHPQTAKLVELIKAKTIGEVGLIQAAFGFKSGFNAESRTWSNALAGGGIMDVGCYAVSAARLIAGAAVGKDFADPEQVAGAAKLAETGVDAVAVGTLKFPGGILAQVSTAVGLNMENVVRVFGSEGSIFLPNPWVADRINPPAGKNIVTKGGKTEEIDVPSKVTSFTHEIDAFGRAVMAKHQQAAAPAMTWDDTLGQARTLDRWRQAAGVVYEADTQAQYPATTVSGATLSVKPNKMKYLTIPGNPKKVSRLVLGQDNQLNLPTTAVMADDFFEKGGNTFDTAFIYGGGLMERLLGQWTKVRGVREQVNFIVKGCHTPEADPISLKRQFNISLDRLQTDYADIYMMHRDNLAIPVGEFVDAMNDLVKEGRLKVFGGSNWTLERVQAANDYAAKKGLQGFSVVSNNFSLARMVDPVWGGCVAASDPDSRAWFTKTQTTLLSWSSQARGFFVPGRAAPDKLEDKELVRCWYSDDNFERQKRAFELAKKYNVQPISIALAYVLAQPFPTVALIGPRLLSETRTSLPGLEVELTPDEVKWLNLEA